MDKVSASTPTPSHDYTNHEAPNHAYAKRAYDADTSYFFIPVSEPIFSEYDRVPSELSGRMGKGRTGKIDSCIDCGSDYLIKIHNATRCPECSKQNQASYVKSQLNKST